MVCEQMRQRLHIGGGQVGRGSAVPLTGGCPSCPPMPPLVMGNITNRVSPMCSHVLVQNACLIQIGTLTVGPV